MPERATLAAVVLAGGPAGDALAVGGAVPSKALLPIGDQPMAKYVLAAIRQCSAVDATVYVGPTQPQLDGWYDHVVPGGSRLTDSLSLGLGAALATGAREFLVITADLPWIDGEALTRFLAGARALGSDGAELVYAVVEKATALAAFPEQERTFVKIADGSFTGGNAVYLRASAIGGLLPAIDALYRGRKNPLALAGMMGLKTIFGLVTGTATIAGLEARAQRLLGVRARALISQDAAIAADVDRPAHVPGSGSGRLPPAPLDDRVAAPRRASS